VNLNVHFHIVAAEVAWLPTEHGAKALRLARLQRADVQERTRRLARRVRRLLKARGQDGVDDDPDALELLRAGSQQGLVAIGERAGRPVRTLGGDDEARPRVRARLCAQAEGFDVHAGKPVRKGDRLRLEKLLRVARPEMG
jgi:hypothetical protein